MIKGMSRRKLFQAAAAAPAAMQMSTGSTGMPIGPPRSPYPYPGWLNKTDHAGSPIDQAGYLRDRVKSLRANLERGPSEDELIEQNYSIHHLVLEHYNSLRSLSPVRRARLAHDAGFAQSRERIRQMQMLELRQVLKQLAGFG